MVTQETLDALEIKRQDLLKEAEAIEAERNSLDIKKDAKRLAEIEKTSAQFNKDAADLLKQYDDAKAEIEKRAKHEETIKNLKDKKSISIQKDTLNNIKGGRKFNLDRCVSIAVGRDTLDGIEKEYLSDSSLACMNRNGSINISAGLTGRLVEERRDVAFNLAGQESTFHSMKMTTPIGLAVRLGVDLQFGDTVGVASGIDFFAGPGTSGGPGTATAGSGAANQETEIKHYNEPIPVKPQRADVPMNLSSIRIGGQVSDLSRLQSAATAALGKWVDVVVFGYLSEVFKGSAASSSGAAVVITKGSIDIIESKLLDQGIFSATAGIVADTSLAGAIRGFTRTTSVPYIMNGRLGDVPFYGYPLAGITNKGVMGAHFENVQVKSTGITIVPKMETIQNNIIKVGVYADLGAINLTPSSAWYIERLKAS